MQVRAASESEQIPRAGLELREAAHVRGAGGRWHPAHIPPEIPPLRLRAWTFAATYTTYGIGVSCILHSISNEFETVLTLPYYN